MILYKTKYYGLLGDRVRKAIAESGRKSSEERQWIREAVKNAYGETPTSSRTIGNLFEREFFPLYDDIKRYKDYLRDKGYSPSEIDYILKHGKASTFVDRLNKLNDTINDQFNIRKQSSKTDKLFRSEKNEINNWLIEDSKINLHNNLINKMIPGEEAEKSYKKLRKNPNDEILTKDIEKDLKNISPTAVLDTNAKSGRCQKVGEGQGIHSPGKRPGILYHELQHYEDFFKNGVGLFGRADEPKLLLQTPNDVWYTLRTKKDLKEGRANKLGFRKLFLNKHSGGRDWRAMNHDIKDSNSGHYGWLGIDVDKIGMQDLDYNMSPEALKKMKENAKKLGIDLNKTNKVSKETPTKEQLDKVMKYVDENKDRL
jgi:arsenate reductase-like glutaredoxin family protein